MIKNIIIVLLISVISLGAYVLNNKISLLNNSLTQIAQLKTAMSAMRIKHAKKVMKIKIRERAKRALAAIPVVGLVALGWFEKREYDEWKQQHPDGDLPQYTQQVSELVAELADEYYAEIKKEIPYIQSLKNKNIEPPSRLLKDNS